jgi:hypothetical protein
MQEPFSRESLRYKDDEKVLQIEELNILCANDEETESDDGKIVLNDKYHGLFCSPSFKD